jgi:EAL and modified HD-GYP domain-containing signal transduction protein
MQRRLIRKFGSKIKFLAEKIETRADYQLAYDMGYHYFQGYFFSKPAVINSVDISSLNINLIRIMEEIRKEEPSYPVISSIIEQDVGLSYKLLRLVNSAYFASGQPIKSIQSALAILGTQEISRWISMMMFKRIKNVENAEMLKLSLIRGKHMELLATELHDSDNSMEYFFTGMFSFIDVLLNRPMVLALKELSLPIRTRAALLGQDNPLRRILTCALACEQAHWEKIEQHYPINRIGMQRYMDLYFQALKWAQQLKY